MESMQASRCQRSTGLTSSHQVSTGKIEWHIPSEFTPSRPAITYSHVAHEMPTTAHPAASRIPKSSKVPAVVADPDDLADLVWADGYRPSGIKDYIDTDAPVLGLRVHTFHDATLVALQWKHVAFDALGLQYVLEAWYGAAVGPTTSPRRTADKTVAMAAIPLARHWRKACLLRQGSSMFLQTGGLASPVSPGGGSGTASTWPCAQRTTVWSACRRRIGGRSWNGP